MVTPKEEVQRRAVLTVAHRDYEKGLNLHAFFRVHDRAMSEELVQDTFMKTWRYLVKGGRIEVMKAFLYHILNDLIIDEYRKSKTVSLDVLIEKGFEPNAGDAGRFLNVMDGKAMLFLIQRLPQRYQKVLRLRYVQELSLKEISLITGQSKNTIAVQVHRGLKKLKLLSNPVQ